MIGSFTTPPVIGTPAAFRYVIGSCSNMTAATGFKVIQAINALSPKPAFIVHLGDLAYDDNRLGAGTDALYLADLDADPLKQKRSMRFWTRYFRKLPEVQTMLQNMPFYWTRDDHDLYNDSHWDTAFATKTYDQISQLCNQAYIEQTPHPALYDPSGISLGFEWDYAACRFIMVDTRSQRRYTTGTPTLLGHNSGHEHIDHYSEITSAITQAGADGVKLLHLLVGATWAGNANDGFGFANADAERAALSNHIRSVALSTGMRVIIHTGDMHMCAADDGTNSDYSTGGIPTFAHFVSSPWNSTSLDSGTFSWNGGSAKHATSDEMLAVYDVDAANEQTIASFYDCAGVSPSLVAEYDTSDLGSW